MSEAHLGVRLMTSFLADIALSKGQESMALARVGAALEMTQSEDHVFDGELMRLRALLMSKLDHPKSAIEAEFVSAWQFCRQNSQKLFALKTTVSALEWSNSVGVTDSNQWEKRLIEVVGEYPQIEGCAYSARAEKLALELN